MPTDSPAIYGNPYFVVASRAPNVSVSVEGNSEKTSPQAKNTAPDISANNSASAAPTSGPDQTGARRADGDQIESR